MELWNSIRQRVLRDGVSIRQIQRETGLHFKTIKKILSQSCPPPFKSPERVKPKIGPYLERIAGILESDMALPKKQRHTANGCGSLSGFILDFLGVLVHQRGHIEIYPVADYRKAREN